ncbi:MAG TPA: M48 family metalloprotease [Terriglobales bacterium]|jgi:Zn-dependent protease with chaperone function
MTDLKGGLLRAGWSFIRRYLNIVILLSVSAWWSLSDSSVFPNLLYRFGWNPESPQGVVFFWFIPITVVFGVYGLTYFADTIILHRKWTPWDLMQLVFWRTMSPTVTLLVVAMAFEDLYERRTIGVLWLGFAAVLTLISVVRLRAAQGMKLQRVKSGELYKRAFAMAKRENIELTRVYVVPAGKGHLTNAYGMSKAVAITDNYGKFLDEPELDFVVAHELGHVKRHHGRKKMLMAAVVYGIAAVLALIVGPSKSRPVFNFVTALGPILLLYFVSRRFEYESDRIAVGWTGSPEAGIQALVNLYRVTETPSHCHRITELFMTHPSLSRRVQAIQTAAKEINKAKLASSSA